MLLVSILSNLARSAPSDWRGARIHVHQWIDAMKTNRHSLFRPMNSLFMRNKFSVPPELGIRRICIFDLAFPPRYSKFDRLARNLGMTVVEIQMPTT